MSATLTDAVRDSTTMLRRNLRHTMRYPVGPMSTIAVPVVFLLLFVGILGDTMGAGLTGADGGRGDYLAYVVPGILLISIAGAAQGVAISVAMDMTKGIINRFRTMAISRASVLTGHVIANVLESLVALSLVLGLAVALGYSPEATAVDWLAVAALLTLISVAIVWIGVAMALVSKTVEGASNLPMPLMLLPFLGSGFVPTDTMPTAVRWFAEHQPFTPMMEAVRALLAGQPIGNAGTAAVAWALGLTMIGYLAARRLYDQDPQS